MKEVLLRYIKNSPYSMSQKDWSSMSVEQLLKELDAEIDITECLHDKPYEIVEIHSYEEALQYKKYAPDWCIMESRAAFDEYVDGGRNRFFFCVREDVDRFTRKAFGEDYPYDNYGFSLIAVCVNGWGRLVAVTSRWNYEEDYGRFLHSSDLIDLMQISTQSDFDYESAFCPNRIRTILHLSDTHGAHRQLGELPPADLIVHSGDVGRAGTEEEIVDFFNWFLDLPYRYKVFVPGNHDSCLLDAKIDGLDDNCYFLSNSGVMIEGLKIYGVPAFVEDAMSGRDKWNMRSIPGNTDIIISHQPPYAILDFANGTYYGSYALLRRIGAIKPRLVLCGHIHDAYGEDELAGTRIYNSALMDESYRLKNKPHLIETRRKR